MKKLRKVDEVVAAVNAEVKRCLCRAVDQAVILESIASQSYAVISEVAFDEDADRLLERAHMLQGVVAHGITVLAQLQAAAGELGGLAEVRAAHEMVTKR